ncbi:hypothetical protein CDL15_Pgr019632 [Punica granatum]|uniref:Anaphase-promoting complex subunit 4 WD40 domain-containing protein n=1 Tax=Punica granatum TaxID=22663 RepID=A0A218X7J7_PUNGR|nr:hypothetical protein CDL15_Pgr019632 [Punica granatum]
MDRFILSGAAMDFNYAHFMLMGGKLGTENGGVVSLYQEMLVEALGLNRGRILAFNNSKPPLPSMIHSHKSRLCRDLPSLDLGFLRSQYYPERNLDAPGLIEDYYMNLLDWGGSNIVKLGLENNLFLWNASNSDITEIWDAEALKQLGTLRLCHNGRVSSLSWNSHILTTSGRDGLQLASGGDYNLVHIWDMIWMTESPSSRPLTHQWIYRGSMLNSVDTGSQVCTLVWNRNEPVLLSSHGFAQHGFILWKYPSMKKLAEGEGHPSRFLHREQSPDRGTVAALGDERLRFWNIFSPA